MARFIVCVVSILLWSAYACTSLQSQTIINAAGCDPTSVQTAINNAAEGDTVYIPAGTCTWTTGVTVKGKGINILGAGTSRIIAVFNTSAALPLATGAITETITGADPGYPTPSITVGQTLQLLETGTEANTLTGTVTAWTPSTMSLTLNITGTTGACGSNSTSNCKRWMIATVPSAVTTIVNNNPGTSGPLFSITEDTAFHTSLSNFQVLGGAYDSNVIIMNAYAWPDTSGQAILIHDCRISENPNNPGPPSQNASMILPQTLKGVIWNCSFETSPYAISTVTPIYPKVSGSGTGSWTSVSNMGALDSTGQGKIYIEDNDFHANEMSVAPDDNERTAIRYNLFDNAGVGTHGADTSDYGQRYFEFYNNTMVFEGYNDGTTFNINEWFYIRGGTAVIANNIIPPLSSGDYGTKVDLNMTVMNLQRNQGPNPCWGSGFTTAGQYYHAPRQVGMGYVTGTGTATSPHNGLSNATNDSITYVGDSEPLYIWGNSRSPLNDQTSDYGGTGCASPDSSANYIKSGRDYIDGTAKPGWSPYTWPHPLRSNSTVSVTAPAPPVNVQSQAN